jgi:hypothetical protein
LFSTWQILCDLECHGIFCHVMCLIFWD